MTVVYASSGKTLRVFLQKKGNVRAMNRVAGTMMLGVGLWMAVG